MAKLCCPACGKELGGAKWVNQGDQRYMTLFSCPEHGDFLVRARFRKYAGQDTWTVNRLVYEADEEMKDFYKNKAALARRRGRGHSARKKRQS